jgi:hypothetical protein
MLEILTTINILELISGICFIVFTFFILKNWKKLFSTKYMKTLDLNGQLNNLKFGRKYFVILFLLNILDNATSLLKNNFGWWDITVTCFVLIGLALNEFMIHVIKDEIKSEIDEKNIATTTISMMATKIKDTESKYDI